jgi:hypothetical protein
MDYTRPMSNTRIATGAVGGGAAHRVTSSGTASATLTVSRK